MALGLCSARPAAQQGALEHPVRGTRVYTAGGRVAHAEGCRLWQGRAELARERDGRQPILLLGAGAAALRAPGAAFAGLGAQFAWRAATWHA